MNVLLDEVKACPIRNCDGKMRPKSSIITAYNWALPLHCSGCNTVRFLCRLCNNLPNHGRRLGKKCLIAKTYLWRHNVIHHLESLHESAVPKKNSESTDVQSNVSTIIRASGVTSKVGSKELIIRENIA